MRNIVFIGMPGSGKTTVSKAFAGLSGRPWFDNDREIASRERMSVPEIFAARGEPYFRQKETESLEELLKKRCAVIAVGGGAVVGNEALIRKNAAVVYVRRDLEAILASLEPGTRPLLADPKKLYELYGQRREIYERMCDAVIDNDSSVENAASAALAAIKEIGL